MSSEARDRNICIIAGMPRASTTFLYHTLAQHPSCFVPNRKELEYFSLNQARGKAWYLGFFSGMSTGQIGFDISPIYFLSTDAARLIAEFFASPRVILIVRNPADFAVSFYKNRVAADGEDLVFDDFVAGYRYIKDGSETEFSIKPGGVAENVSSFCTSLGENLLLVDFREIQKSPLNVLSRIEEFCGIEAYFSEHNFENVIVNASDQLNIKTINRLMHQKWFADLVTTIVPKRLIMAVRYRLQTSKRSGRPLVSAEGEAAYLSSMRSLLKQDIEFVDNMFARSAFVLGTGESF